MEKAYLELLVLGKIPGTNITLSFWQLFIPIATFTVIILVLIYSRMIIRGLHRIDPFYGAPKEMNEIDLLAL